MAILIVETGMPPGDIPKRCGATAQWFLNAMSEIGKRAEIVRPYLGETLPGSHFRIRRRHHRLMEHGDRP